VLPWEKLATAIAPDGTELILRRRGEEMKIHAGGYDLMSSEDDVSSKALAELTCTRIDRRKSARVLVGGLGMGYTLRAALECTGPDASVEVSELVPAVAEWNRDVLAHLAQRPLDDSRASLHVGDVAERIRAGRASYDAILLDTDNGPESLAHAQNDGLYSARGLAEAWNALRPGGALGVWSFSDDAGFTKRLERQGFSVEVHRVSASRKGRGRYHFVWVALRPSAQGQRG